jgi:hypothetical protein
MKRYIILSVDSTDEFNDDGGTVSLLAIDLDTDDLTEAESKYETLKMELSNVYLVEIRRQSENI